MRRALSSTLVFLALGSASSAVSAGPPSLPFPMRVVSASGGALTLELDPQRFAAVRLAADVVLTGVPLPGVGAVDVEAERVSVSGGDLLVAVDGYRYPEPLAEDLVLLSGGVVGEPDSHVFFSFSRHGSRGRVRVGARAFELLVVPPRGARGDWTVSRFFADDGKLPNTLSEEWCAIERLQRVPAVDTASIPPTQKGTAGYLPLKELRLDVETDFQFFQKFNDLNAAATYALSLVGAVSDRYREEIGVIFTIPYLGLYTQNNDPWTQQDQGGDCIAVLNEFQAKWKNGNAPVPADLHTMLSAADLGCGVAWLDVLCNQTYGFSVEGNLNGGLAFPPQQGGGTWDFVVLAHELGHNFGSPHTHDFCPTPLDECAPKDYFGACQNQQVCTSNGTNMSYCHLCPGGMTNINLHFHTVVSGLIRQKVDNSCLIDYVGIPASEDLGFALAGGSGVPSLTVTWDAGQGAVLFDAQHLAANQSAILFLSPQTLYAPFLGGTLVPNLTLVLPVSTSASGTFSLQAPVPASVHLPTGQDFYVQLWAGDPAGPFGASATNAVRFELVVP